MIENKLNVDVGKGIGVYPPDLGNHLYLDVGKRSGVYITKLVYQHREIYHDVGK
jgi:hypothetical protein